MKKTGFNLNLGVNKTIGDIIVTEDGILEKLCFKYYSYSLSSYNLPNKID